MSRLGLLSDPEGSGVYVGFLAGVLASNPGKAEALIASMFPLSAEHHWAIVRAVAYSGRPEWQALLRRVADRMPQRRVMIERFLDGKLPTLDQAPIEKDETWGEQLRAQFTLAKYFSKPTAEVKLELTPDLLDTLWGYYYATGNYRPLARIILMLRWTKERDALEKLTLGSMAKYTLAINSARNADLLATLQMGGRAASSPTASSRCSTEVIEAAETFETGKLRNAALASIDELQAQGARHQARHFALGPGRGGGDRDRLHRGRASPGRWNSASPAWSAGPRPRRRCASGTAKTSEQNEGISVKIG